MKIKTKIINILLLFILVISLTLFFLIKYSSNVFVETIKKDSIEICNDINDEIDNNIREKLFQIEHLSHREKLKERLIESRLNNTLTKEIKCNRKSIKIKSYIYNISKNRLSEDIKEQFITFYQYKLGYSPYKEIIITDNNGINVMQTNTQEKIYHKNSKWWILTKKNGKYIGEIIYDEGTNEYIMPVSYKIESSNNDFIGVIKVKISIFDIINEINLKKHLERDLIILNSKNQIVFHSQSYRFLQNIKNSLISENIEKNLLYFEDKENIYIVSSKNNNLMKWKVILKYEKEILFKPMKNMRYIFIHLTVLIIVLFFIILYLFMKSIVSPIKRLKALTNELSEEKQIDTDKIIVKNDEFGELTKSFIKMSNSLNDYHNELNHEKEKAQEANNAKSDFIANMSHELRTPMNGILGISKMFVTSDNENLTPDQKKGLELIYNSGKRLLDLVNDILDLSKIESGELKVKIQNIDLDKFIYEIQNFIETLIKSDEEKDINFIVEKKSNISTIMSDEKILNQILINLLSNAFKFTHKGEIRLKVYIKDDKIFFEVTDTGIGIKEKYIDKIFGKFVQIDGSSTKKYKGTGLGLHLTKNLVNILDGDIKITSKYGYGTTAKVWFE